MPPQASPGCGTIGGVGQKKALELLAPIHDRFTQGLETAALRAAKALFSRMLESSESPAEASRGWMVAGEAAAAEACHVSSFPERVSDLIGREAEFREVADLIRTHRLVTLTGEGGVGKTRLGILGWARDQGALAWELRTVARTWDPV